MTAGDDLTVEMTDALLDDANVSALLGGGPAHELPPAYAHVAALVRAATAPGAPTETEIPAALLARLVTPVPANELDRARAARPARRRHVVLVASALLLSTGGVAAAATGHLPTPLQGVVADAAETLGIDLPTPGDPAPDPAQPDPASPATPATPAVSAPPVPTTAAPATPAGPACRDLVLPGAPALPPCETADHDPGPPSSLPGPAIPDHVPAIPGRPSDVPGPGQRPLDLDPRPPGPGATNPGDDPLAPPAMGTGRFEAGSRQPGPPMSAGGPVPPGPPGS